MQSTSLFKVATSNLEAMSFLKVHNSMPVFASTDEKNIAS